MMKFTLAILLLSSCVTSYALDISEKPLGTYNIGEEYFSVPQYLPYYPTAATIWPRVVEIQCDKRADNTLACDGYNWSPEMGRAEYLFVVPVVRKPACCQNVPIVNTVIEKQIIYKEVPQKKGRE